MSHTGIAAAFCLAAACLVAPAMAQSEADAGTQSLLAETLDDIRATNELPAIGGAVSVRGQTLAAEVQGVRRTGGEAAVTLEDKWHLGSITKSMTATLAGQLVETGRFDWDTPLAEMLPDIAPQMDPQWRGATLQQLLTHSAGAPDNFSIFLQFSWPETPEALVAKRREEIAKVLAKPPVSQPGTEYLYSNIGYTIVGHIIETAFGVPWEQAMRDKLFSLLELDSAGFGAPTGDNPWGHGSFFGMRSARNPDSHGSDNTPIMGPAGAVHMDLADLVSWGETHLKGEKGLPTGYMQPATFQQLHEPALEDYASGWVVWQRDWADGDGDGTGKVIWHNGSNTMWYALLVLMPEKDAVIALVTNDGTSQQAKRDFFTAIEALATSLPQKDAMGEE